MRYVVGGGWFPGVAELIVEGVSLTLVHQRATGVWRWTGEVDPFVVERLTGGLGEVEAAPVVPGSAVREIETEDGAEPIVLGWDDTDVPALRLLDTLISQLGDGAVPGADDGLPRLVHRRTSEGPGLGPGSAAAFGPVADRPAYAITRPGVTFALYGLRYGDELGRAAVTEAESRAVALGGGLVATGGDDGVVRVWDAATGGQLHATTGHGGPVHAVAVSGGLIFSGGDDGVIRVWTHEGSLGRFAASHDGAVNALVTGDGLLYSGGDDGAVHVLKAADGSLVRTLAAHDGWVTALAASGGLLATAGSDGRVRLWRDDERLHDLPGPAHTLGLDGAQLTATAPDGTVTVWEDGALISQRRTGRSLLDEDPLTLPSGDHVTAGATDESGTVYGTASGDLVLHPSGRVVTPGSGRVLALAMDDELLVSGGTDGTVRVVEARTGRPLLRLRGHTDAVTAVALGHGLIASAGHDRSVRVWETGGRALLDLRSHAMPVYAVAFGTVGDRVVVASGGRDGLIPVLDAATGEEVVTISGVQGIVRSLCFLPGDVLAAGCQDGTLRRWRLPSGEPAGESEHGGPILAISPEGFAATQEGVSRFTVPSQG
ncbi:WD40 repeat domain-containing protein [Nonomuraea sp. NBC_01738]|uniref:WD40 repeat domain-containing protein n=1 Tax=Nonomuraea sp. NBC_01738 TaxID=2976003 RepID=UPI002E11B221|nr:WD40 repeat domain-containing protein [Nonomuraea sp. NBC_01738]